MTALLRCALLVGGIRLQDVPSAAEARRLLRFLVQRDERVAAFLGGLQERPGDSDAAALAQARAVMASIGQD